MTSQDHRAAWLARLLATGPADRTGAESAVRRLYSAAGFPEPRHLLWFDSPFEASWAVALLMAPHHGLWTEKLRSGLSRDDKARVEKATAILAAHTGVA